MRGRWENNSYDKHRYSQVDQNQLRADHFAGDRGRQREKPARPLYRGLAGWHSMPGKWRHHRQAPAGYAEPSIGKTTRLTHAANEGGLEPARTRCRADVPRLWAL